ncbi:hypothetical protein J2Y48_004861 [Mycoplana sp. BE70]|nr:hypothetical protein [Mycoplana sp. BE70]
MFPPCYIVCERGAGQPDRHKGHQWPTKTGLYGTDYLQRALIASEPIVLRMPFIRQVRGALLSRECNGSEKYVITFPKKAKDWIG